ncbi:hypothetical protein ACDN41_12320 [Priestia aryabhattai]|uniref:hypothetical protein n=1 Tax=Priestia aryabhattai TaxID=412384 RepID=UPI003532225A
MRGWAKVDSITFIQMAVLYLNSRNEFEDIEHVRKVVGIFLSEKTQLGVARSREIEGAMYEQICALNGFNI